MQPKSSTTTDGPSRNRFSSAEESHQTCSRVLVNRNSIRWFLLSCLVAASLGGCDCNNGDAEPKELTKVESTTRADDLLSDLEAVAVIGSSDDETGRIIQEELQAASIECWIEGSVVHVVSVKRDLAEQARSTIRDAERLKNRWVQVVDSPEETQQP